MLVWGRLGGSGPPESVLVDPEQGLDQGPWRKKPRAYHFRALNAEEGTQQGVEHGTTLGPSPGHPQGEAPTLAMTLESGWGSGKTRGGALRQGSWPSEGDQYGPWRTSGRQESVPGWAWREPQWRKRRPQLERRWPRRASQRQLSRLIWQKLICSKFEDLTDNSGGAPGTLIRLSPGALSTGHPLWL